MLNWRPSFDVKLECSTSPKILSIISREGKYTSIRVTLSYWMWYQSHTAVLDVILKPALLVFAKPNIRIICLKKKFQHHFYQFLPPQLINLNSWLRPCTAVVVFFSSFFLPLYLCSSVALLSQYFVLLVSLDLWLAVPHSISKLWQANK